MLGPLSVAGRGTFVEEPQSSSDRLPVPTLGPRPKRRRLATAAVAEGLARRPSGLVDRAAPAKRPAALARRPSGLVGRAAPAKRPAARRKPAASAAPRAARVRPAARAPVPPPQLHARLAKALEPSRSSPASAMALSRAYSDAFQVFLAEEGGVPSTIEDMEVRVLQFLDLMLEAECTRADATILVAAVKDAYPWDCALQVASTFFTYIRPGALRKLQVRQLLAPSRASGQLQCWGLILAPTQMDAGAPGDPRGSHRELTKTGTSDETVIIDHPVWLGECLAAHVRGRAPTDLIFPTPGAFVAAQFGVAARKCGLPRVCLYQLRHGGASGDILS
ncbi:unnamed protein product, partial [Prorocentrum cordatum]